MIVWDDIEKLTKNYHSGIKKLDGLNENTKYNNNKTNHKNNFKFKQSNDDYGLDDKVTIRPFHIKYDSNIQKLMVGKSTPSKILGKHNLSSGTIEAIKYGNSTIPKIDYSYVDPQYFEHKLKGKTNKDFILKELSKGQEFARNFLSSAAPIPTPIPTPAISLSSTSIPSPAPTPSLSTRLNDPLITQIQSQLGPKFEKIPGSGGLAFQRDATIKEI